MLGLRMIAVGKGACPTLVNGRRNGATDVLSAFRPAPVGIFLCAECGEVLSTRDQYEKHQKLQHGADNLVESEDSDYTDSGSEAGEGEKQDIPSNAASNEAPRTRQRSRRGGHRRRKKQDADASDAVEVSADSRSKQQPASAGKPRSSKPQSQQAAARSQTMPAVMKPMSSSAVVAAGGSGAVSARSDALPTPAKKATSASAFAESAPLDATCNTASGAPAAASDPSATAAAATASAVIKELWIPVRKAQPGANGQPITLLQRRAPAPATAAAEGEAGADIKEATAANARPGGRTAASSQAQHAAAEGSLSRQQKQLQLKQHENGEDGSDGSCSETEAAATGGGTKNHRSRNRGSRKQRREKREVVQAAAAAPAVGTMAGLTVGSPVPTAPAAASMPSLSCSRGSYASICQRSR